MDCLVTKLKGNVSDNSLLKIGEFRAFFIKNEDGTDKTRIIFNVSGEVTVSVIGSGTVADSEQGAGSNSITFNTNKELFFSDDINEISVSNKYAINSMYISGDYNCKKIFYINDYNQAFDYSKLSVLKVNTEVRKLGTLDISRIDTKNIFSIILGGTEDNISLMSDVAHNLYGEITELSDNISQVFISGTDVKMDLAVLQGKNVNASLMYSGAYGNIEVFAQKSIRFRLNLYGLKGIYGDVGKLTNCYLVSASGKDIDNLSFTYTTNSSRNKKLILNNVTLKSGIDQYLIDQAAAGESTETNNKVISIKGTRTSASDTAVSTLKSQGYTVNIVS